MCLVLGIFVLGLIGTATFILTRDNIGDTFTLFYSRILEIEEVFDLVILNSTSALCLDGSPGSYYLSRNGDPEKVLVFFQGGGWAASSTD